MDEAGGKHSANGADERADQPHRLSHPDAVRMIGWYLDLRTRLVGRRARLDGKEADFLDVSLADFVDVLKFLARDPVLRRAGATLRLGRLAGILSVVASGGKPGELFGRESHRKGKPPLERTQKLRGVVAHLVEVLIAGGVKSGGFRKGEAATLLAKKLHALGATDIEGQTVGRWHASVIHHATRKAVARHMFDALQKSLTTQEREYERWPRPRRQEWLAEFLRRMWQTGYFCVSARRFDPLSAPKIDPGRTANS